LACEQPDPIWVEIWLNVTTGALSQLSVTDGVAADGTLLHSTVKFAGTPLNTGALVSCTVRICWPVLLFPQASVAVHVRVIV
jgi:hypothetical protein